jgi:carbamate kinase
MSLPDPSCRLLIALGGNALNPPEGKLERQKEEFIAARRSMESIVALLGKGFDKIILTHGNGPQVGRIFRQQELTLKEFPRQVTLDVCVADSQGRIGYILQNVFDNACAEHGMDKRSSAIITQVVVDPDDPAFLRPTKPIGVFYTADDAEQQIRAHGWIMQEDAGRGYRRLVASPQPLEIVEKQLFRRLLDLGFIVIGAGGGGVPVVRTPAGNLQGVEAVIDKDLTSSLLANEVGIDHFIILTAIDRVYLDFRGPRPTPIHTATAGQMQTWLNEGHFAEGSMQPKVEGAIRFLRRGGKRAIIAHLDDLLPAVEGRSGTHILP